VADFQSLQTHPSSLHWVKSISLLHLSHLCVLPNSSEKISFFAPHSGHVHVKDFKLLNC